MVPRQDKEGDERMPLVLRALECFGEELRCLGALAIRITTHTILFKIITRMKLSFWDYLGDCSCSFQGSFELICVTVTVTVSLVFEARCSRDRRYYLSDTPRKPPNVVAGASGIWGHREEA